jgi:hypothetical protein
MGRAARFLCSCVFVLGCNATAGRPDCEKNNTCAGTTGTSGGTTGGGGMDMTVLSTDLAMPPVPDLSQGSKGFGEPCGNNSECASDLCVLAGIGGICSKLCNNDPCPEGYGCYGVLGAVDPGQVAQVCVPDKNLLCTPCNDSVECSTASVDICYAFPSGGKFCARDCTTVSCPTGYSCQDVTVGAASFKQCLPVSGACDCNAMLVGSVKACPLTTPFGTCTGKETCMGDSGWSGCAPPSTSDIPDDNYSDDNCDGIDGDVSLGIFVAKNDVNAVDDPTCGTLMKPCKSIGQGMTNAVVASKPNLYVQAASYNEVVILAAGKSIFGGYDNNWQRAPRSQTGHTVTITGALESTDGQYLTVKAHDLIVNSTIADVVLVGPTPPNPTANGATGQSTYVVHAKNATLTLHNVTVTAGNGAKGHNGSIGGNASNVNPTAGMSGAVGGNGQYDINLCNDTSFGGGGGGGTNASCGNTGAGSGGNGGKEDTDCCCQTCLPVIGCFCTTCTGSCCNATSGSQGGNGAQFGGSFGHGGVAAATCSSGSDGQPGSVHNGPAGSKGSGGALDGSGYWATNAGSGGGAGGAGGGGGGGSGSGGCDSGNVPFENSAGGGGGGGGAGGCAAVSGGGGGGGGGATFAVVAYNSTVTVTNSTITRGAGGGGGDGGNGGRGQSGGAGQSGGLGAGSSPNGNKGGDGAHGGHGGGGGGGAGGHSYGVFIGGGTSNVTVTTVTFSGPSVGGAGGARGLSAPTAPIGQNDGNDGLDGDDGVAQNCNGTLFCP